MNIKRKVYLSFNFKFPMPQFDTFTFLSQLFWVFLLFGVLYISLLRWILPAIAITLKTRKKLIQPSDVDMLKFETGLVSLKAEPHLLQSSTYCKEIINSSNLLAEVTDQGLVTVYNQKLIYQCALNDNRISACRSFITLTSVY